MKKILFAVVIVFVCLLRINAQFVLTPSGLKVERDTDKDYVVYEYAGVNKTVLYKNTLLFIQKQFRSPKDVLNEIPDESITIHGIQPEKIGIPYANKLDRKLTKGYASLYDVEYTITIRFKDEKIRIDTPDFECYKILNNGQKAMLYLIGNRSFFSNDLYIYNAKNEELKWPEVKDQIEMFFNAFISALKESILTEESDEW